MSKTRFSPTCPMCGETFATPEISGGYVRCPSCSTPMFQYRIEGDELLTRGAFIKLLHPRANEAVLQCIPWFAGNVLPARWEALYFVVRLWPTLAAVFPDKEPEHA